MKISATWLADYLPTKVDAKTMAERLERAGIEVEQIIGSGKLDRNIIVARVTKVTQHPNADRLKLVEVDTGAKTVRIVCGGPNVAEGQIVALAQTGTVMPDGTEIKPAVIRGEASAGMLCTEQELGLSDDQAGVMVLDPATPVGSTLCDIVDSDQILDITTAANRSDLLSARGLAREIAAQGGEAAGESKVKSQKLQVEEGLVGEIDKNLVKRYMLARVKLGKNGESPEWMQKRLQASGIRPINSVVDITNYVMVEWGQPLHAFDADNVKLPVEARSPRSGEKLTTLDGTTHLLDPKDLIIADATGPIDLAGVMGGLTSQIITETNEVLLESANFDGPTVRRSALRHGLRTDASSRFERNLPLPLVDLALSRALELLVEHCDAEILSVSSQEMTELPERKLDVSLPRIEALLGIPVTRAEAESSLRNLGFGVAGKNTTLELSLPWWRPDVTQEADITEEVGRSLGYDRLPATLPAWAPADIEFDQYWSRLWQLKAALRGLGLDEVVTYSFVSLQQLTDFDHKPDQHLKLQNPLSLEQAYLRSSLAPSLVATVARNAHAQAEFGLFEVSKVYEAGSDHAKLPDEPLTLGVIVRSPQAYSWAKNVLDTLSREFNQFQVKPMIHSIYNPRRSAQILLEDQPIGWIGEIHPSILAKHKINGTVGFLELRLLPWMTAPLAKTFRDISRFPAITRDLSVLVAHDVLWTEVETALRAADVAEVAYVSEYHGDDLPAGTKSLTLRLTFRSLERTLTDTEADAGTAKIMKVLEDKFQAKQR